MTSQRIALPLFAGPPSTGELDARLRFGNRGTHTSRTIMLVDVTDLLDAVPASADRESYAKAIIEDNVLGKPTTSSRRSTNQRLGELYALDPSVPLFRVFRRLWDVDPQGRSLLAILCALARDPLLRASADAVIPLAPGAELVRSTMLDALREESGDRLSDPILDKVARNAASSWSQSGHLRGRVRKIRHAVLPTPGTAAFALWLGSLKGATGEDLLHNPWTRILDRSPARLLDLALQAKQLGFIDARTGGNVIEIDPRVLDSHERVRHR